MADFNQVSWFEIPVADLDRAEKFYQSLLKVELDRQPKEDDMIMSCFPMSKDSQGASGALVQHETYQPSQNGAGIIIYFTIPHFDEALEMVENLGGELIFPKKDIGEHGFIARIKDTEGNQIAIHTR